MKKYSFFSQFSDQQIKQQYAANAKTFAIMYQKAVSTGKKVNGYTAEQLKKLRDDYTAKSN